MLEQKSLSQEVNVKLTLIFPIIALIAIVSAIGIYFYCQKFVDKGYVLGTKTEAGAEGLFGSGVRLVKTANDPRVYAVVGNQKHLLRNEEVFYGYDFNFNNVEIVGQKEMDSYNLVRLVREQETGRVYYLNYVKNLKRYHPSMETFATYQGNKWEDVVEVSSQDLSFWEEVALFKTVDSSRVYYITADNKKAWIPSADEFANAGLDWNKIMTVSAADLGFYQEIEFNVSLANRAPVSAPGQSVASTAQLIVTMDNTSPPASLFPFATEDNLTAAFRLQAVRDEAVINSITFTKKGILKDEKIRMITVEDENGVRYGQVPSPASDHTATVLFNENRLVIPLNSRKILKIKVSFAAGTEVNNDISFGIERPEDINADIGVAGIFPLFAQSHKLVSASELIGGVNISSIELNSEPKEVNIGISKEVVAKFNFIETSGTEKIKVEKIILTNEGTAQDSDLDNIAVYKEKKLLVVNRYMVNNRVVFDLSDKDVVLDRGESAEFTIKVDVLKGEDRTLKFIINDSTDLSLKGMDQGFSIYPAGDFPIGHGAGSGYNQLIFKREGVGIIARKLDEDDREIYREQQDVVLADFELRNINQDIYLQRMKLKIEKYNNAPNIESSVIVRDNSGKTDITTLTKDQVANGATVDFNLNNYKVGAQKTIRLAFIGDVPEGAQAGNVYRVVIQEVTYKIGIDNTSYVQARESRGQLMVVYAPRLAVTPEDLINGGNIEAGKEDAELARFNLAASVDEKIKITEITVTLDRDSDDVSYVSGFSNLALYIGNTGRTRKSAVIEQPDSRTFTFTGLKITISAGKSISLFVRADTEDIAAGQTVKFKLDSMEAEGYSSHAPVIINGEDTLSQPVSIVAPAEE